MFTPAQRRALRDDLVKRAHDDKDITAAALVGSAARDAEDEWSDIDLALRLRPGIGPDDVVDDWTTYVYETHHAVDHLDVWSGPALYRVFLIDSSLQIDLSFWPWEDFSAKSPTFRLLFGEANPSDEPHEPQAARLIGMAWLYALHVRSSVARGRRLQAIHMLNGLNDQTVALACIRYGLPSNEGRGADDLPADLITRLTAGIPRGTDADELRRAFAAATDTFLTEARHVDEPRAALIANALAELVGTA
jgi:predicted nucleotidyltransferase